MTTIRFEDLVILKKHRGNKLPIAYTSVSKAAYSNPDNVVRFNAEGYFLASDEERRAFGIAKGFVNPDKPIPTKNTTKKSKSIVVESSDKKEPKAES